MENKSVTKFREYLRIKTVHPNPDYDGAVKFLREYAEEIGLEFQTVPAGEGILEIAVMTWKGADSSLPSIVLNSHTDVVPVYPEHWKHAPFDAHKDEKGNIYARGTQDMKCVGIQYLEAVAKLKNEDGCKFLRDIHLLFVPEEETGGVKGMQAFMKTELFRSMNIGFVLDEGLANTENKFSVFYGERTPWWVNVSCVGDPGHGSRFVENNTPEKLRKILNLVLAYRQTEEDKLVKSKNCITLGDVTTVNLTGVEGGIAHNLVPAEIKATFDFRIAPTVDLVKFEAQLKSWCEQAGTGVTYTFIQKSPQQKMTTHDDTSHWWRAFKQACDSFGVEIKTEVFPAATDSRFLRQVGYPAIGFSPIRNTPILLHDHNEFLNEDVFLQGIECYLKVIPALANVVATKEEGAAADN